MEGIAAKKPDGRLANEILSVRIDGGVLRLTMNRPAQRNALSEGLIAALQEAIDGAAADPAVRVVVVAATGPAFSAGHDLKEITVHCSDPDGGQGYFEWLMGACSQLMQRIVNCPKPVIAEVQGLATAAGCQLVASCDLAVTSQTARFGTPGVAIGLFCSTPMVALSRNVPRKHAMEMLLTGDTIDAEQAERIGLVNRVVRPEALQAETAALARKIAGKSAPVLKIGKEAFYAQAQMPLAEAYNYCSRVMVENLLYHDAEEGISAFIEKRRPQWQDG